MKKMKTIAAALLLSIAIHVDHSGQLPAAVSGALLTLAVFVSFELVKNDV